MDPFTLALATFGIQKLRGKSTRNALQSAALVGGGSYLLGPSQAGVFKNVGGGAPFSGIQALLPGGSKTATPVMADSATQKIFPATQFGDVADGITTYGDTEAFIKFKDVPLKEALKEGDISKDVFRRLKKEGAKTVPKMIDFDQTEDFRFPVVDESLFTPAKPTGIMGKAKKFYDELTPGQKFLGATVGIPAVAGLFEDETPVKPPFTEEDYEKAYQKQSQVLEGGFRPAVNTRPTMSQVFADPTELGYATGGIIEIKKFNKGGINYLPSKSDHNENDSNNYVRATGYVEDGSGNGDKDEDTMLAQLADGEFVSRADAVLGAGIMAGASPKDTKDARKKGAAFFYDQQKKLKRIYDITNASKTN
jgi:hypothetical protein